MSDGSSKSSEERLSDFLDALLKKATQAIKPVLVFGLGLHWVWLSAIFYSSFSDQVLTNPVFSYTQYPLGVTFVFFFIVVTFGMGALSDRITYFIRRRRFQMMVAITLCMGTACLFLSNYFLSLPLLLLAESINGLASGFLLLIWSEGYRRREPLAILVNSYLSVLFGFIVFRCVMYLLPPYVASILIIVTPFAEFILLYLALHGSKALRQRQQFTVSPEGAKVAAPGVLEIPTFHKLKVHRGKFFIRMSIPFFFFGMVLKLLGDQVFRSDSEPTYLSMTLNEFLVSTILPCLVLSLIALVFISFINSNDFRRYNRYIIPLVSVFILLACLQWLAPVNSVFSAASFLCLESMLWAELCIISHRYRISPILVAGFGRGAMAAGMLCIAVIAASASDLSELFSGGFIYTFMLAMLVVGYSGLPREQDISAMAIIDPVGNSKQSQENEDEVAQQEDKPERREKRFVARCERIANMYLLSPREVDVFFLLAKGRNTAYISKHLYISEGTVHTHMRHIYKKLDIHRQQELIDLVDAPPDSTNNRNS